MQNVKVSIVTPCLNSEKTIRDTIESVLYQTYRHIEYIIIDGGSTDYTLEIIKEYVPMFQGKLRYISEADKGIYNAMNKGICMSTGRLIGILNSDDYYEKNAVENIVDKYKDDEYQVLYGYMRVISNDKRPYICKDSHQSILNTMIPHPTCFLSRKIYREFGLYLEGLKIAADYELMLRLNKTGKVHFQCIQEIITNFRCGGASTARRTKYEVSLLRYLYGGLSGAEFVKKIVMDTLQYKV